MKIDVFEYVASNEPRKSQRLIENYGYEVRSRNMAQNLRELVQLEGDDVVHDIMKIHPDYEYFNDEVETSKSKLLKKKKDLFEREKFAYLNASGNQNQSSSHFSANQTNMAILVAAMFLSVAIITKK